MVITIRKSDKLFTIKELQDLFLASLQQVVWSERGADNFEFQTE